MNASGKRTDSSAATRRRGGPARLLPLILATSPISVTPTSAARTVAAVSALVPHPAPTLRLPPPSPRCRPRRRGGRRPALGAGTDAASAAMTDFGSNGGEGGRGWRCHGDVSPLQRTYERSGGILYRQSALPSQEFAAMREELLSSLGGKMMPLSDESSSSVAKNRVGTQLPWDHPIVKMMRDENGGMSKLVNAAARGQQGMSNDQKFILSENVPVEVRVYEKRGAGMDWHVDDVLFSPEQVEVVFTIENTSDCVTMWEEVSGETDISECKRVGVETSANSAILLRAGGVRHKVSPLKVGRRTILKFVYVKEGAKLLEGAGQHLKQFSPGKMNGSNKNKGRKTKRKGGKR